MKSTFSKVFPAAAAVALLSGQAQAQDDNSTVIQVFWITEQQLSLNSIDQFPLAGSIVTADASSTVVAVECTGSNVDTSVCGTAPQTITFGSTTWAASETNGNLGVSLECSIAPNSESAVCTGEIDAPEQIFTDPLIGTSDFSELLTATTASIHSTSYTGTISSSDFTFLPVTVTAGQSKLAGASGTGSSSGSSSGGGDGNGGASLKLNLGLSGLVAGFLGMAMLVL